MTCSTRIRRELRVLVCLLAVPALALTPEQTQARRQSRAAQTAYDLGRFPEALAGFSEAYRLDPRPAFLFNIAQCHRLSGAPEKAAFFFERYLSRLPPGSGPTEARARELLREVEAKAALLRDQGERPRSLDPVPQDVLRRPVLFTLPADEPVTLPTVVPRVEVESSAVWRRWWFWTGLTAVAAGGVTAAVLATRPGAPHATLADGSFR